MLPPGVGVEIDGVSWAVPAVFAWLARDGGVALTDMVRTFNCGIGMAVVVAPEDAAAATELFSAQGETVWRIGRIVARAPGAPALKITDLEGSWPR